MLSWRTIRNCCAVLLMLPLVHLVILISRETLASLDSSPTAWQDEVDAYIHNDETVSLPEDPIVVIGGRRVALWRDLEAVTAPKPVLVRALGDATVDDLQYYHERLVSFYRPEVVVLVPGNSEFQVRDDKTARELVAAVQELAALDARHDARRLFYVITPIKTTLYTTDHNKIDAVGSQLRAWAQNHNNRRVLDANRYLATLEGDPDPAYFRSDGVQLNDAGYMRLGMLLREQLRADYPQDYTVSAGR